MSNSIAISRDLVASGFTQQQADAVAEKIVTHADESHATKADLVRVEAKLEGRINTQTALSAFHTALTIALIILVITGNSSS